LANLKSGGNVGGVKTGEPHVVSEVHGFSINLLIRIKSMKLAKKHPVIVLTQEEREELQRLARKNKVMVCFARRAKVILALDEGKSISETARLIDMERRHIYKWISRYKARGRMGLNDLHRSGRPRSNHTAVGKAGNNSGPSESYVDMNI
jgi:hypothetical protein